MILWIETVPAPTCIGWGEKEDNCGAKVETDPYRKLWCSDCEKQRNDHHNKRLLWLSEVV